MQCTWVVRLCMAFAVLPGYQFMVCEYGVCVCLCVCSHHRYCAVKLAEGAIGDVDALPEGVTAQSVVPVNSLRVVALDTQPDASTSFTQIPTAVDSAVGVTHTHTHTAATTVPHSCHTHTHTHTQRAVLFGKSIW